MKSAIQTVQEELYKVQNEMQECVSPEGIVRIWLRERYLELMKQETRLRDSLKWLKNAQDEIKKKQR